MSALVNRYEIDMRVSTKGKDDAHIVTRIEHAYSVMDAIMQAVVNHSGANPSETIEATIRVSPPADEIRIASTFNIKLGTLSSMPSIDKP